MSVIKKVSSIIYGPVPSWRLGRSLGIDLVSTEGKTCSFDCIYCQLGRTIHPLTERREFVTMTQLAEELETVKNIAADYITFSGVAEPTLASNLGQAIQLAKSIFHSRLPVAILTNSSLMPSKDVRRELSLADIVVAKLDAPNEELFQSINRPVKKLRLDEIVSGIRCFRSEYQGKLALQIMFVETNRDYAHEMARLVAELSPDEVQINTPLRPCAIKPLTPEELAAIKQEFSSLKKVTTVYEAKKPDVTPLNLRETLQRRPKL